MPSPSDFEIHLVGDTRVGATQLMQKYAHETGASFPESASKFNVCTSEFDEREVRITICDKKRELKRESGRNIMLLFDLSDANSLHNLTRYLPYLGLANEIITLVGTKSDKSVEISPASVETFVAFQLKEYTVAGYIETSAVTGDGVSKAFEIAVGARLKTDDQQSRVLETIAQGRKSLIDALNTYIKKIELHTDKGTDKIKFGHDFMFFQQSRALNQEINYLLAKSLSVSLQQTNDPIQEIFSDIEVRRTAIIAEKKFFDNSNYVKRGLNDTELLSIIDKAKKIVEDTPPESRHLFKK
jgi:hypothetical protein